LTGSSKRYDLLDLDRDLPTTKEGVGGNHRSRPGPKAMDLTLYGKPAFGRLPIGLGKPAAGFPQLHSLDGGEVHNFRLGLDSR